MRCVPRFEAPFGCITDTVTVVVVGENPSM